MTVSVPIRLVPARLVLAPLLALLAACSEPVGSDAPEGPGTHVLPRKGPHGGYSDGRPVPRLVLQARDQGVVLRHGDGPGRSDVYGARDVWVWEDGGTFFMHYDAAGPEGWLAALATSRDLVNWEKKGPVLTLGGPHDEDSKSASYGVTYEDGGTWHMFYLGTPVVSPAPERVPMFPYVTMKATAASPAGPWVKQRGVMPFRPTPGTYYAAIASPGHIIRHGDEYVQFFSAAVMREKKTFRTLGIARTRDLNGRWTPDPEPILPLEEQIENASLYYEEANQTWFLFTNHVGVGEGMEYTDAIWVYWSKDLNRWNRENRALVLDGASSKWSKRIIGLPSVIQMGDRLALFYDGREGNKLPSGIPHHMNRDVGLAWLPLPLVPPAGQ